MKFVVYTLGSGKTEVENPDGEEKLGLLDRMQSPNLHLLVFVMRVTRFGLNRDRLESKL